MRAASSHRTVTSGNGAEAPEAAVASRVDAQREQSLPGLDGMRASARKLETSLPDLFVVGGQQQALRPLHAGLQPWYRYRKGVVLHVRTADETIETALEYVSPPE